MATSPFSSGTGSSNTPLWASGRFALRVHGVGSNWQKVVEIRRPHALIGRIPGSDVLIDDRLVSARHVYLHLDSRGLFAVDLASRSGSRIGPQKRTAGWLQPGDSLEVAGRWIEVLDVQVNSPPSHSPDLEPGDPLSEAHDQDLVGVTLYPGQGPQVPLALNSKLVFLGRSAACGVHIDDASAARIQCVLVRSPHAAYILDLLGRTSWLNGRPLRDAQALKDGDTLAIGSARFECRLSPPGQVPTPPAPRTSAPGPGLPATRAPDPPPEVLTRIEPPPLPTGLVPAEAQGQVLAWMMGVLQATQGEMLRRQSEFQNDVIDALKQIQDDNHAALGKHLETVETLNQQLSSLRDEVRRRFGPSNAPSRPEPPKAPPLRINPAPPPTDSPEVTAAWLLNRVSQIDQENRSSWR
ncbi:MAG TPA: FHA domain-containing protein, partial [Isosphaeraceae bacterium]|nr:FHA domain-containing protein [Isosphaeraceae bacterium]